MLVAKCGIMFTIEGKNYKADTRGEFTGPAFKLTEEYIVSGLIKSNANKEFVAGEKYKVNVEFFTLDKQTYEEIKADIFVGKEVVIQVGRKIIGMAKILELKANFD